MPNREDSPELPSAAEDSHVLRLKTHLQFKRTRLDKIADFLTVQFGSLWFLIFNAAFFLGWIEWNLGWFGFPIFDPFPFNFLTMTVSLEAIFLSVVVLISQNRQSKIADIRQQVDMEIDARAEAEITKILCMVDDLHKRFTPTDTEEVSDPEIEEMESGTDLERIQREIERNSDF